MAIYSIKHSSKKPFLEETREDFEDSLETYVGGAFTFAQESLKRFFADHGEKGLVEGGGKKGVCVFTFEFILCALANHGAVRRLSLPVLSAR
jgi:NAD(P)-dependent dehydrogenase (short-subunit alcohol dehydrogenase family)